MFPEKIIINYLKCQSKNVKKNKYIDFSKIDRYEYENEQLNNNFSNVEENYVQNYKKEDLKTESGTAQSKNNLFFTQDSSGDIVQKQQKSSKNSSTKKNDDSISSNSEIEIPSENWKRKSRRIKQLKIKKNLKQQNKKESGKSIYGQGRERLQNNLKQKQPKQRNILIKNKQKTTFSALKRKNNYSKAEEYEIDQIIDEYYDKFKGVLYYYVSWVGYSNEWNDWLPESDLQGSLQLIRGFKMNVSYPVYEVGDNWGEGIEMEGIRSYMLYKKKKYYLTKWYYHIEDADSYISEEMALIKNRIMVKDFEEKVKYYNIPSGLVSPYIITSRGTFETHDPLYIEAMRISSTNQIEYCFYWDTRRSKRPDYTWCSIQEIPEKHRQLVDQFQSDYEKLNKQPTYQSLQQECQNRQQQQQLSVENLVKNN